jgi:hypothetical protein
VQNEKAYQILKSTSFLMAGGGSAKVAFINHLLGASARAEENAEKPHLL